MPEPAKTDDDAQSAAGLSPGPPLSSGESAVLVLVASGLRIAGIAARLRLAPSTISSTLRGARDKTGGANLAAMVDRAYRGGLLPAPAPRTPMQGTELDPEERRTLLLRAAGATVAEIAADLLLPHDTAGVRIRAVHNALGAGPAAHAIHIGWELGYLHPGEAPPTGLGKQAGRTTATGTYHGGPAAGSERSAHLTLTGPGAPHTGARVR